MAVKAGRARPSAGPTVPSARREHRDRDADAAELLERSILETERPRESPPELEPIHGVVVGTLAGAGDAAGPRVDFPGNPFGSALPATSIVGLAAGDVERQVALAFDGGNPGKPIILGLIHRPEPRASGPEQPAATAEAQDLDLRVDGERITFTAKREIVLRCGEASITLTRAGKVLIRGAYVVSRSSGVNRIKGGSVQIN